MSMSRISHVVVHYSATYADQNMTAADIDKMHRQRGWRKIGYHWFIRRNGTVEKGRAESEVGAHVGGQNSGKIGICWAGGLDRSSGPNVGVDNRTPEQTKALIKLIRDILKRHPGAKVVGHRDLASTLCPGFDVPAWWAMVQSEVPVDPKPAQPNTPATTPGVSEDKTHAVEAGDTLWSISREHGLSVDDLRSFNPGIDETAIEIGDVIRLAALAGTADPRQLISTIRANLDALEKSIT